MICLFHIIRRFYKFRGCNLYFEKLSNKKFLDEELKIDSSSDYVDIYLQSVKLNIIMRLLMMVLI